MHHELENRRIAQAELNGATLVMSLISRHRQEAMQGLAQRLEIQDNPLHPWNTIDWLLKTGGEELARVVADPELTRDFDRLHVLLQLRAGSYRPALVQEVDLPEVIQWAMDSYQAVALDKQLGLHVDLPNELPALLADDNDLLEILETFLHHAVEVSPPQGMVTLSVRAEGGYFRFEVSDSGPNMPQEEVASFLKAIADVRLGDRMLEPGGSDFKFSLACGLIRFYGGDLGIESMPDKGSTRWFTLPASVSDMG